MREYSFIIAAILYVSLYAQNTKGDHNGGTSTVEPIESARLQGPHEAIEAEKEYARRLAKDRAQQAQIDNNLPLITENGQAVTPSDFYYPAWGYGVRAWRLHKGLDINLGASAFASFGHGNNHGAGFSQDMLLVYVTNLSKKATLAVGGYVNHLTYHGDNYFVGGINTAFGHQFNKYWNAYAFVQEVFTSSNFGDTLGYGGYGSPYWAGYGGFGCSLFGYGYASMGCGYGPTAWAYGTGVSRYMDRIGGGVTYQWGSNSQNSISVSIEFGRLPSQRNGFYSNNRYDYPVR